MLSLPGQREALVTQAVGFIGLGVMGSALSTHLLAAGWQVVGYDTGPAALAAHQDRGGTAVASSAEAAGHAEIIVTSLPTAQALRDVVHGLAAAPPGRTVIETSTLPIKVKENALRVVLLHGGGYLPYQIGRLDHGHRVRPEARGCAQPPSAYLTRFWFDTVTHAPAPLRLLTGLAGTGHVLYGTDFPFDMAAGPLADQLAGTGLGGEDAEAIGGGNARLLFRLDLGTGY